MHRHHQVMKSLRSTATHDTPQATVDLRDTTLADQPFTGTVNMRERTYIPTPG